MERVVLHCDANSFYASVCCSDHPIYRGLPLAVCGRQEERHGIVLAATREAKKLGIKTGMTNGDARKLCPRLVIQPPDYPEYMRFSRHMTGIYREYTPLVQSFGLDESWVDISNPGVSLADGEKLANTLRKRMWEELGITISVGVSYNKIFAKLGSDLNKPNATTVISRENYRDIVWPLPASDLLYVGGKNAPKLAYYGINTIGDLANSPPSLMKQIMGKNGLTLLDFARGEDQTPVEECDAIKSIGNSATLPHDVTTKEEAAAAIYMISESVAARLRDNGLKARCISIGVRDTKLNWAGCQHTIDHATALSGEIARTAIDLFSKRYTGRLPLRSMGVHCSSLVPDSTPEQTDLFGNAFRREKELSLARSIDDIRRRWGHQIIQRAIVLADPLFAKVNPKEEHLIHPVSYFNSK
jgi:DNA polymerase-4